MGRGLGKLQRAILALAEEKNKQDVDEYVRACDVLISYYGFPLAEQFEVDGKSRLLFDRRAIGFRRYMSASVTVAQCFSRLAARGLVERTYGRGIRLSNYLSDGF